MRSIKEVINTNLPSDYYEKFLRPNNILVLDKNRIDLAVFCGDERRALKTITDGDSSLILRYKEKEGVVLSLKTETEELGIVQLQGSRGKPGYRISTGFFFVDFFGDQIKKIVNHSEAEFQRITMPSFGEINGMEDLRSEMAINRYQKLVNILGLRFSNEEWKFIKEIREPNFLINISKSI